MDKELFSIGDVASIKGITIKALRFYDRIGLLKPHYVNPENQYRYYHVKQFIYIDIIKASRALEISPQTLIPYFQKQDTAGTVKLLSEHKQKAQEKIKWLQSTIQAIEHFEASVEHAQSSDSAEEVRIVQLDERYIYTLPFEQRCAEEEYLIDYSRLGSEISRLEILNMYDEGILYSRNEAGEYYPDQIFTTISQSIDSENCLTIPSGKYICICFSRENLEQQSGKLNQYLVDNEIEPTHIMQVELMPNIYDSDSSLAEFQVRITD